MSLETFLLSCESSFPFSDVFKKPAEESIVEKVSLEFSINGRQIQRIQEIDQSSKHELGSI